ncbi:MAG: hypothetical protein HDR49_00495 [Bacteroides sp.]|nr:hypothetical protein [Bacteroides sp.]MBD5421498.1 hypothetical protein [Bacteroides sp.]
MKEITFRIPTSLAEFRQMRKERLNKRYRNNVQIIRDVIDDIIKVAHRGYYRKDISETMLNQVFHSAPYSSEIDRIYQKAKMRLK